MQRLFVAICLAFLVVLTNFVSERLAAQESTPAPSQTIEYFVGVPSERAPGHTVYLIRFTMQPGGDIEAHSHPGTTILTVEEGMLGYTLLKGTAHVIRSPDAGESATTQSVTEPGSEVILEAGDTIFYEADVVHMARNAGDAPVKVHATHILENGQPLSIPANTDHTATPSGATSN